MPTEAELTLDDLLADALIQDLMAADGVDPAELARDLRRIALALDDDRPAAPDRSRALRDCIMARAAGRTVPHRDSAPARIHRSW